MQREDKERICAGAIAMDGHSTNDTGALGRTLARLGAESSGVGGALDALDDRLEALERELRRIRPVAGWTDVRQTS
ncbi:hypothetical protein [Sagittula salina]|uniref:Uncharacterized protein n=1 Tax=Sagittula salina TaxID=2820268 RepID=A0A940S1J9_9RHOB|nr:hypothetical protein [Sagittula salina]MBP0484233.1 hypothetical protein [Sagittula salina]